jgi:hypothetical protein
MLEAVITRISDEQARLRLDRNAKPGKHQIAPYESGARGIQIYPASQSMLRSVIVDPFPFRWFVPTIVRVGNVPISWMVCLQNREIRIKKARQGEIGLDFTRRPGSDFI